MSRQINTIRVSQILRKFFYTQKSKITLGMFKEAFKSVLNAKESTRLFEYLIDTLHYLKPYNKVHYGWSLDVREECFSEDKVRDIFLKEKIQSKFGYAPKPKSFDISNYSDTELSEHILKCQKELEDRRIQRDKETRKQNYAVKLGCSVEQLPEVLNEILGLL